MILRVMVDFDDFEADAGFLNYEEEEEEEEDDDDDDDDDDF